MVSDTLALCAMQEVIGEKCEKFYADYKFLQYGNTEGLNSIVLILKKNLGCCYTLFCFQYKSVVTNFNTEKNIDISSFHLLLSKSLFLKKNKNKLSDQS